jgi:type I restriction enzyme S subunit
MRWTKAKFKSKILDKSGYTWSKEQELKTQEENSIRVLTVSNIQKELDLKPTLYLNKVSDKDYLNKRVSKDWTIAVSSNGNRNRIGNAVFIDEDSDYLFASFLVGFIPKNIKEINPKYFYYWLNSNDIQSKISSISEGTTGLGNLDLRHLRNSYFEYPKNPEEQTAITGILTKVDEAINSTQNSIKAAEKLKKALMQNLLTGKLKPDGTWRKEDEFYTDEKYGKYPLDWNLSRYKDFAVLQRGKDLTDNNVIKGIYPVVKSNGVKIHHNEYFVEPPGVVTGRSGTIGNVFYLEEKFWSHNTSLYVKDFKGNNPKFIYYFMQRMDFRKHFAGTTVPTLNRNDVHRLKISIPKSNIEQEEIASKIESFDEILEQKTDKIKNFKRLKKSLMQNLLTGKKRVEVEKINKLLNAM